MMFCARFWICGRPASTPSGPSGWGVFTEDAVFQGLSPYTVGRQGVRDYYAGQPRGTTVRYSVLESRRPAADVVHGYVQADFAYPDRPPLRLYLSVVAHRIDGRWSIAAYQASREPSPRAGMTSRSNSSMPERS
ncbi:hypothetical protein ACVWWN_002272 [Mycobacterium sp. URHB0021]